ncbi:MAG: hypothetical protein ACTHLY_01570 [Pseudolabrys sp.]
MLLAWLGERRGQTALVEAAAAIERALDRIIEQPQMRTADLGCSLGTAAFAEAVSAELSKS